MLVNFLILVSIFILNLTEIILPIIEVINNSSVVTSHVIKNNKLLGNAVYQFEQSELPLCSQRYQKISVYECTTKNCSALQHAGKSFILDQSIERELLGFCVTDSDIRKTS